MKVFSLTAKRVIAGVYGVFLILFAANHMLEWQIIGGGWDKTALAVIQFIGLVLVVRFGQALVDELKEYRAGAQTVPVRGIGGFRDS